MGKVAEHVNPARTHVQSFQSHGGSPSAASVESPANAPACADWADLIPEREWDLYEEAAEAIKAAGGRFMLGGAFGLAGYTGRWRNTKDIDFFLLPEDREKAIHALTGIGFRITMKRWRMTAAGSTAQRGTI